jgi:hypothetical protein
VKHADVLQGLVQQRGTVLWTEGTICPESLSRASTLSHGSPASCSPPQSQPQATATNGLSGALRSATLGVSTAEKRVAASAEGLSRSCFPPGTSCRSTSAFLLGKRRESS